MPIHDQSYRRYGGGRARPGQAWLVIARTGVRNMLRKRLFLLLLLVAWVPFFVHAVMVYFAVTYPQTSTFLPSSERLFRGFLQWQDPFVFFVTVYVGAGLIANDRRTNALQIYLSKPLMRTEYILGKAAVLFTFLMLVTFVPAMLLLFVHVAFTGSFQFMRENAFLVPAITIATLLQVLVATFTMLALSSLSKSSRYVGILFAGAIFFSAAISGVLYAVTASTKMSYISLAANVTQIGDLVFRVPPRYATPWQVSLIVILALIAVSISVLERRVRGVEVVT